MSMARRVLTSQCARLRRPASTFSRSGMWIGPEFPCPVLSAATSAMSKACRSWAIRTPSSRCSCRAIRGSTWPSTYSPTNPERRLPLVEVHVMEHGLLMLEGQGVYRLGDDWYPVRQGDVIWMAPFCPQWFVAMGKGPSVVPLLQGREPRPDGGERHDVPAPPGWTSTGSSAELDRLARKSDAPAPAVTRVVYTDADLAARAYIKDLCAEPGCRFAKTRSATRSRAGKASGPTCLPVGTGSHIDAIPHSGRFDGTVGVLGGLAAIRACAAPGSNPSDRSSS